MVEVKIRWGRDGLTCKTYQFETEEQKAFWLQGVEQACGWLEYEVETGCSEQVDN